MGMKIKDTLLCEQPREKMASLGAGSLSNAELLAIILGNGTRGINVVEVCRGILSNSGGSLSSLSAMTGDSLSSVKGIGWIKAQKIAAAFELGRRFCAEIGPVPLTINGPRSIYDLMMPLLKGLDKEEFWSVFLNARNRVIQKEKMSVGGTNSTVIDVKILTRRALETKASSVVMVHNHPSGDPWPSPADAKETAAVHKALKTFEIDLLDHVIVGHGRYYSFAEEKSFAE